MTASGQIQLTVVTQVRPETMRDEARAKCLDRCPRCGDRLWYLAGKWPSAEILAAGDLLISPMRAM